MFLYLRLLLAHFLGDYPFQFNKIYLLKQKGFWGVLPHTLLIVLSYIIMLFPYLHLPQIWVGILIIGVTHQIQDWAKIKFIDILKIDFIFYVIDQILHIALITLIFRTKLRFLEPPISNGNFLINLYNNNSLILLLIATIVASYNGYYMILLIKKNHFKSIVKYSLEEKWYGMIERAIVVFLFFLGRFWPLLAFPLLGLRFFIFKKNAEGTSLNSSLISTVDIVLSGTISILCGILVYGLI